MARADLKPDGGEPGISVFWIILLAAALAFVAIATVLLTGGGETEPIDAAGEQEIVSGEGDEPPGTTSFGTGDVADEGPTPTPDIPGEAGELDESEPPTGQVDDTREAGTVGAVDADPASDAERGEQPGVAATLVEPDEEEGILEEEEVAPEEEAAPEEDVTIEEEEIVPAE